ncbi:MAG: hypothetical protein ABIU96_03900 [Rhodanobacter sp.]
MVDYVPPINTAVSAVLVPGYTPPVGDDIRVMLGGAAPPAVGGATYAAVTSRFGRARQRSAQPVNSRWRRQDARDAAAALRWQGAQRTSAAAVLSWLPIASADRASGSAWGFSRGAQDVIVSRWNVVFATDRHVGIMWQPASRRLQIFALAQWVRVFPRERGATAAFGAAPLPARIYQPPPTTAYVPPVGDSITVRLGPGYTPPAPTAINVVMIGVGENPAVIVRRADPPRWIIPWGRSPTADTRYVIRWGPGTQYRRPDPPPTGSGWTGSPNEPPPIPIARRVYIVMNDVSVVRLPDRTPIEVLSVDLQASVDAWCWSLRMDLADPTQVAQLKPDGDGPKLVEITMNSYVWTAIIEGWDRSREYINAAVTVTGRSQTALLSENYTAKRSKAFADAYSAQQLANLEISERALPFTIDWQGLDWVVPGGVWYYQDLSPIDVISQIAAARGAVVQSAPGDASLIVQSRYPVSPWSWSAGVADVALPLDWITGVTAQQQSKPMYDAVIIAGQQQGVLAKVTRLASAGQTFAAQVVDQLNVTADVATERGRNVLSDRGIQEQVDMDIPLFAPGTVTAGMSGLYAPLLLVDVQDPADPWQGQTVGVTISARRGGPDNKALEIWQRVSLERHLSDAH